MEIRLEFAQVHRIDAHEVTNLRPVSSKMFHIQQNHQKNLIFFVIFSRIIWCVC